MAGKRPINVVIQGEYTDKDVKRAIADLKSLQNEAPAAASKVGAAGTQMEALGGKFTNVTKSWSESLVKLGGVIAGAFAAEKVIDFFKESMAAAAEDQKSMIALATAMDNVGLASKNAVSEDLIRSMSMMYGIADDQLRPSFQKLVTVTKDVDSAQRLLRTALDLSAAGYGDLTSTTKALSAAANGNFTALQRLKLPIDANTIAAKDFEGAVAQLNSMVGGQAAAAAETYQGKLARVTVAVGEAKEAIGYQLLTAVDNATKALGGSRGLTAAISGLGDAAAGALTPLTDATSILARLGSLNIPGISWNIEALGNKFNFLNLQMLRTAPIIGPILQALDALHLANSALEASDVAKSLEQTQQAMEIYDTSAGGAVITTRGLVGSFDDAAGAAADAAGSVAGLSSALAIYSKVGYTPGGVVLPGGKSLKAQTLDDQMKASLAATRQSIAAIAAARKAASSASDSSPGGSSGPSAAEKKAQDAAQQAVAAMKQRLEQLKSYAEQAGRAVTDFLSIDSAFTAFSDRQKSASEAYAALIDAQKQIGEEATQAEKDRVAELQKVYDSARDAAGKGAQDIVGEFVARAEKAKQFGEKLKMLLANNLNKQTFDEIAGMSADRGSEVADAFINGNISENISRVNDAVNSAKVVADSVGVQAATTFKDVGEGLALGMMRALASILDPTSKPAKALNAMMDGFAGSLRRVTTVDIVTRRYEAGQPPPAVPVGVSQPVSNASGSGGAAQVSSFNQMTQTSSGNWFGGIRLFAEGGIVTSPTMGIVGESGPEAVIPLSRVGQMGNGGNTYKITVQAGVGDPRQIGQQIVEYITRWENANGQRYARTA